VERKRAAVLVAGEIEEDFASRTGSGNAVQLALPDQRHPRSSTLIEEPALDSGVLSGTLLPLVGRPLASCSCGMQ